MENIKNPVGESLFYTSFELVQLQEEKTEGEQINLMLDF